MISIRIDDEPMLPGTQLFDIVRGRQAEVIGSGSIKPSGRVNYALDDRATVSQSERGAITAAITRTCNLVAL